MTKDNTTVYAILGLLNHQDLTGYDIKKRFDVSLGFFWNASFGQIYPTLKSMEEAGLVCKTEEEPEGRARIVYSITEAGKEALQKWLMTVAEKEYVKYEILLKLFFGSIVPPEQNIKLISEFKNRNMQILNILQKYKEELSKVLHSDSDHLYYYLTVLFGEKIQKAYSDWADEAIKLLEEDEKEFHILSE